MKKRVCQRIAVLLDHLTMESNCTIPSPFASQRTVSKRLICAITKLKVMKPNCFVHWLEGSRFKGWAANQSVTFLVALPSENNGGQNGLEELWGRNGADPAEWHILGVALCK